jgi:hypothetical protein
MSNKKIFLTDEAKKYYYEALDLFQPLKRLNASFLSFCLTEAITREALMQSVAEFFSLGAYVFRVLGYAESFFVTVNSFS